MLILYKRGKKFWTRGTVHGRYIRTTLDTQHREVAWQRMIDLELHGGRKAVPWSEFAKQFLEWKKPYIAESSYDKYDFVLARFETYLDSLGITMVHDVEPATLSGYSAARQLDKHPHTKGTVGAQGLKSDLRLLHAAFGYAIQCGYLAKNPVITPNLKASPGQTLPFTKEEIARLLASPYVYKSPYRWALVHAFLYTGLRISDISAMQKSAVSVKSETLLLRTTKRDKDVFMGLHPELKAALEDHLNNLNHRQKFSPFVFATETGRRSWPQSMDAKLRRIFKRCGIAKGHAHRFRDTFAVNLLEQGASLYDVSKLLGTTIRVAEEHYTPYVRELRERAKMLVNKLDFGTNSVHGSNRQKSETG